MNKLLVVIDVQNDFVSGSLGSLMAQAIVPKVQAKIDSYINKGYIIMFTKDTHTADYLQTQEGKNLPVVHCVDGTWGHELAVSIADVDYISGIKKATFGSFELAEKAINVCQGDMNVTEIELVGLCTDICVVSNALILKARLPETKITVDASCCAGVTEESHKAALLVMKSCQVNVIGE